MPFIIRYGSDASSDVLRRAARCMCRGHKGATLQHPRWVNSQVGRAPFPAKGMECFKIGTRIGNVKNDEPSLIEPIGG